MEKKNSVEFLVYGRYALFSDVVTRAGGEKYSYQIPTYQGLKGIIESCYWKPTFTWIIDEIRIMNPIKTQSQGIRPINYSQKGNSLSIYTYLKDVAYQVRAHFEWNENRNDLLEDRNENKHFFIAKRMIERGGRRDIFLGTRECQGYIEECIFGEGKGAYDDYGEMQFGLMFHGFDYPDETGREELGVRFSRPCMKNGYISLPRPEECDVRRIIRGMQAKNFVKDENFTGLYDDSLEELMGGA